MKISRRVSVFILACTFVAGSISTFGQTSRQSMQDRTNNWTNRQTAPNPPEVQYISGTTPDPTVGDPVGDSLFAVVLLSGLYLLWNRKMKRVKTV